MAGNITDYLELALLEHCTGKTAWTKPTTTYLALFLVSPTDSTGGTEVALADGYARKSVTWGAAASGSIANTNTITFGPATGTWGVSVAAGLLDASTAGNLLWYGPLNASVTINNTDSFEISPGGLTLSLD